MITVVGYEKEDGTATFAVEHLTGAEALCLAIDAISWVASKTGKSPLDIARTIVSTGEEDPALERPRTRR
jgi:hypothetical protein